MGTNTPAAGSPPAGRPVTGAASVRQPQDGEPGFAAAALRAGFDRAVAEAPDRSGWVNVAAAAPSMFAPPGGRTATDAPPPGTLPQLAPRHPWDDLQPPPARVGLCAPEAELRATPDGEPRQGREVSLLDRFRLNGRHAHTQTLLGAGVEAARLSGLPERDGGAGGQVGPGPRDRELRRVRWEQQDYDGMQSWRDYPYPILAGPAALLGTLVGGAATPESLVGGPAARGLARSGAPLLRTMLQGGARQTVVQGGANVGAQGLNIADGLQDRFDPMSTLQQAGVGTIVGAGAPGVSAALRPAEATGPRALSVARGTPAMEPPKPVSPPPAILGTPDPAAPPVNKPTVYGPGMGNVPGSVVTGKTSLDLSGRSAAPLEPARLPRPPNPLPLPPPPTAEEQLQALPGHGHSSHGSQTTLAQQEARLRTDIAPDGRQSATNSATRFDSHEAELDAVTRATALLKVSDDAGLIPHAIRLPSLGSRRSQARNANVKIVVTGFPGGYGSGLRSRGRGQRLIIGATGQYPNARVTFERNPSDGTWKLITQFPTDEPVTISPP